MPLRTGRSAVAYEPTMEKGAPLPVQSSMTNLLNVAPMVMALSGMVKATTLRPSMVCVVRSMAVTLPPSSV